MKVRQVAVSDADQKSAEVFFNALTSFYDLSETVALDAFARTGDLTVKNYIDKVADVDLWELGAEHKEALEKFKARDVKIGCSYEHLQNCEHKYGLVVVDTPQGCHHDFEETVHVEHFGFLERLPKVLEDRALIVVYANRAPYNKDEVGSQGYDEYEEYNFNDWMAARRAYFNSSLHVMTTEKMLEGYTHRLESYGLKVVNMLVVPCYSDVSSKPPYAFRVAFEVVKT